MIEKNGLRIDFVDEPNSREKMYGPIYKNTIADMNKIKSTLR